MDIYLETHYIKNEYSENAYPQKLCDHFVESLIKPHFAGSSDKTLLDVGCGKGNHIVAFARRGLKVSGLDKIRDHNEALDQFDIRECDFETDRFPFDDNSFDIVHSKSVIEHVANADNFLSEVRRILKPGGLAILMCPDWGTQGYMYYDDYTHVKPWTRKGLQNAMRIHGFKQIDSRLFRQLPALWKIPALETVADIIALCPNSWKWKNKEETEHREWIRFSKEKMVLATATK